MGIVNVFENDLFEDPDGLLPLSMKQMKALNNWARPIEVLKKTEFVNGMPEVAGEITGYEVMQKSVGDCSVISSLAVAAHFEFKHHYKRALISNNIFP